MALLKHCMYFYHFRFKNLLLSFLVFSSILGQAQDLIPQVAENLKSNTVAIRSKFEDGSEEKGFGFITGENKGKLFIATAAHVVLGLERNNKVKNIQAKFFKDIRWVEATFLHHWDQEDLALIEIDKPSFVQWHVDCADFSPQKLQKIRFIGLNLNEPSWVYPSSGEIFDLQGNTIHFSISTIRPGTSGAPLLTEKGIIGLITQDEGGISHAINLSQIKTLFSKDGQYPYFTLLKQGEAIPSNEFEDEKFNNSDEVIEVSYNLGILIAQNLKRQGLDVINPLHLAKGITEALAGTNVDLTKSNEVVSEYFANNQTRKYKLNIDKSKRFLEENKKRQGVKTTASGLQYEIMKVGTGAKPTTNDKVTVHYHGTLIDGKVIDSSVERGQTSVFVVNQVIAGWVEALKLMPLGSKWKLFIPYDLAYGENGAGADIPPYSTLIYEVELLKIN